MRSLLFLPVIAGTLLGQIDTQAIEMLHRSSSALQEFRSGEVEVDNTGIYDRTQRPLTIRSSLAWSAPDKVRVTIGSDSAGETSVTDGRSLVVYSKITREYTRRQAAFPITTAQRRALEGLAGIGARGKMPNSRKMGTASFSRHDQYPYYQYLGRREKAGCPHFSQPRDFCHGLIASDFEITSARIVRNERISIRGSAFDCVVLKADVRTSQPAEVRGSYLLWIDKRTGLVLKREAKFVRNRNGKVTETRSTFVVRRVELNHAIDDRTFEFVPPPGSREVDKLTCSEAGGLIGESLPEMELRNLDETAFNLDSLSGKTVLLSFGSPTCGPWQTEVSQLARLRAGIAPDAMIVLVLLNESASTARRWLEANPSVLPLLLGRTTRLGACPINVIIGKNGKVLDAETGVEEDSELLAKLKRAGATH
jgi:outer membrane lipoprotein-sorting protein